ncbi:MAG: hypothetical protein KDA41_19650, partial [Planctomycetales bacterium]|nr:hypothetical protein [Planctomycetales bacterium]
MACRIAFCWLVALCAASQALAAPRIVLQLYAEKGFPLTGYQQWAKALGEMGLEDVRINPASGGEAIEIEREGTDATPVYRV